MDVAVQVEFKADRKEPLGDLVRRVAAQFEKAGLHPDMVATFSDSPGGLRTTSAVARAIKKHPHLARFERNDPPISGAGLPPIRRLTNGDPSNVFPMADLLVLADGVPRSLPFHAVSLHFAHADFGRGAGFPPGLAPPTGITITDGWWVNGRTRSLSAFYSLQADPASKKLPSPRGAIGEVLAGLGKPKRTAQFVAPGRTDAPSSPAIESGAPSVPREIALIGPIVANYRVNLKTIIERIVLPYDLPPAGEASLAARGASGPLKPTLVEAFSPRGFDCRGGSGTFNLRRRTAANHVVDVELDVGTWSRSLTFMFHVHGPGFNATLMPPVTKSDAVRQYPIGDTASWQKIVANVAAIVDELERTFVPEIEAAVGPAPEWFDPGR
jgi:hypothetical protein